MLSPKDVAVTDYALYKRINTAEIRLEELRLFSNDLFTANCKLSIKECIGVAQRSIKFS